jgi:hypothetical protein
MLASAFIFSCTSSDDIDSNVGSSKSECIKSELQIKANTLNDVATACNAIKSEVLAQLDNFGSCDKNGLSFGKPIGEMMSECDMDEIPVVGGSSSSGNGGGSSSPSGSRSVLKSYTLKDVTWDSFTYVKVSEEYRCKEGGNIEKVTYDDFKTINYSVNYNNTLGWWREGYGGDSLLFAGTSNNLTGTWTRTKNKSTSCKWKAEDDLRWLSCKEGWDIVKAEFTASSVKITSDVCITDGRDGAEFSGWKRKAIDCNTMEIYKGVEKVIEKVTWSGNDISSRSLTYKDKTCTYNENPTASQRENACRKAWNEHKNGSSFENYYWEIFESEFEECLEKNDFPEEFFGKGKVDDYPINYANIQRLEVGGTSSILGSFVDLDGGVAYTVSQVAANASKIDIVYAGGLSAVPTNSRNRIYSAWDLGSEFSSYNYIYESLEDAENFTLLVPLSAFVNTATENMYYNILTGSIQLTETVLIDWQSLITAIEGPRRYEFDAASDNGYIDLATNKVFLALTSEGNFFIIAVDTANQPERISISYLKPM